jgi:hypothetical protein
VALKVLAISCLSQIRLPIPLAAEIAFCPVAVLADTSLRLRSALYPQRVTIAFIVAPTVYRLPRPARSLIASSESLARQDKRASAAHFDAIGTARTGPLALMTLRCPFMLLGA